MLKFGLFHGLLISNYCRRSFHLFSNMQGINSTPQKFFKWCESSFKDIEPSRLLTHPDEFNSEILNLPGCIIDEPEKKLSIPLIDFDPSINAEKLMTDSKVEPSPRDKPLFAIVRGMGGGKTRAFEEIRRVLLFKENVLVIGVTFNLDMTEKSTDPWPGIKSPYESFALSILSRFASMLFELDLRTTKSLMLKAGLDIFKTMDAIEIIQLFIAWMVEKIQVYRPVTTFILLLDETLRMEEEFLSVYPTSKHPTPVLCEAMLSTPIILSTGKRLDVSLAISSLTIGPLQDV